MILVNRVFKRKRTQYGTRRDKEAWRSCLLSPFPPSKLNILLHRASVRLLKIKNFISSSSDPYTHMGVNLVIYR